MRLCCKRICLISACLIPLCGISQTDLDDIFADMEPFDAGSEATSPAAKELPDTMTNSPPKQRLPPPSQPEMTPPQPHHIPAVVSEISPPEPQPVDLDKTLTQGKEAYHRNDLILAQERFEAVLHEDPHNKTAMQRLKQIADEQARIETRSYRTTRSRMLENVQAAWNTPKPAGKPAEPENEKTEPDSDARKAETLRKTLSSIHIPAIAFQNADIQQVVLELSALCRKLDPKQKGVNLVAFGTEGIHLPPITFSGTDLTAEETLDIVTQISGMKYEVGANLVSLTPVNYEPPRQMISTQLDVMPSVGEKMVRLCDAESSNALMDVRPFFSTIPFPPGSSIQYNPEFNILLVRNVPHHLDEVSTLLERYNRKALEERSRQVEIETKFIEVAQGTLEELGFEWTLGTPGETITSDTWTLPGGQKLFTDTLRNGETAFNEPIRPAESPNAFNRYAGATRDPVGSGLVDTAGELLIRKVKGDLAVDLLIRALERQAGSDLLSAPKILTRSGETASIHVGEVHWFPTQFDLEIEREAQPVLIPLDYEEERTGVMLEVTPELDPGNGTINMKLSPEIRELAGYDQQHVATLWPFFNSGGTSANAFDLIAPKLTADDVEDLLANQQGAADRLIARRPVFKTRKVDTSVTIDDGSTLAMGGLIKEKLETFRDSVPLLGNIPLLGRLFRSEGERSVKRNLLIFVTANQVNASGHKKNTL